MRQLVPLKDGMLGRRFSVLEEGHFVAAPEEAEVGDAVFVLIGCSVPVCLRRDTASKKWRLVGECYVYGCMNGEAIGQRGEGQLGARTLLLI